MRKKITVKFWHLCVLLQKELCFWMQGVSVCVCVWVCVCTSRSVPNSQLPPWGQWRTFTSVVCSVVVLLMHTASGKLCSKRGFIFYPGRDFAVFFVAKVVVFLSAVKWLFFCRCKIVPFSQFFSCYYRNNGRSVGLAAAGTDSAAKGLRSPDTVPSGGPQEWPDVCHQTGSHTKKGEVFSKN